MHTMHSGSSTTLNARFVWEVIQEEDMLRNISTCIFNRGATIQINMGEDISGEFSVTAYKCLAIHVSNEYHGIFNQFWQVKTFPNVLSIEWRILLNKMPTRSSLIKRGVVVDSVACEMCQGLEETTQHLFLEYSVAQVWSMCYR